MILSLLHAINSKFIDKKEIAKEATKIENLQKNKNNFYSIHELIDKTVKAVLKNWLMMYYQVRI
jgi:C4-dicarboxylate transporter